MIESGLESKGEPIKKGKEADEKAWAQRKKYTVTRDLMSSSDKDRRKEEGGVAKLNKEIDDLLGGRYLKEDKN
jgi:hypothetical protein